MTPASLLRTNDVVSSRKGSSACAGGDAMIRNILVDLPTERQVRPVVDGRYR
jgi:hypothetical protein